MVATAFVDPVSLMLWLVLAVLAILSVYVMRLARGFSAEKLRALAVPLASVAVPLALLGGWMTVA